MNGIYERKEALNSQNVYVYNATTKQQIMGMKKHNK